MYLLLLKLRGLFTMNVLFSLSRFCIYKCAYIAVLCIIFIFAQKASAYEAVLDTILQTSPSIDAMEYVLITNNDLSQTHIYLEQIHKKVRSGKETEIQKDMRTMHLYYLEAYAYLFHESDISKLKRNDAIFNLVEQVRIVGESLLLQYKKSSDVRRVMAVSMMLTANTGIQGLNKFMNVRTIAINYAVEALSLDSQNPMARVVLNNFDSLAIRFIGAKSQRGFFAINIEINSQWKKPQVFEFYVSQIFAFLKKRDKKSARQSFEKASELYPNSWRLKTLYKDIR